MAQHVATPVARHVAEQVAELVAQHVQATARGTPPTWPSTPRCSAATGHCARCPWPRTRRPTSCASPTTPACAATSWQVIPVEPRLPTDLVRSERYLKIVGHAALDGYDRTLWVDNAVELLVPPETFVDDWLEDADVASPVHTFYRTVLEEAEASIELGRDDHLRVFEQLAHYLRSAPAAVETNPHWTALLARRRTPGVDAAMTTWWEHVLRFSRRDQLAFSVVMAASDLRLNSVPLPNLRSPLHRWPEGWETRGSAERRTHPADAGQAPGRRRGRCAPRSRRYSTTATTRTRGSGTSRPGWRPPRRTYVGCVTSWRRQRGS